MIDGIRPVFRLIVWHWLAWAKRELQRRDPAGRDFGALIIAEREARP